MQATAIDELGCVSQTDSSFKKNFDYASLEFYLIFLVPL